MKSRYNIYIYRYVQVKRNNNCVKSRTGRQRINIYRGVDKFGYLETIAPRRCNVAPMGASLIFVPENVRKFSSFGRRLNHANLIPV